MAASDAFLKDSTDFFVTDAKGKRWPKGAVKAKVIEAPKGSFREVEARASEIRYKSFYGSSDPGITGEIPCKWDDAEFYRVQSRNDRNRAFAYIWKTDRYDQKTGRSWSDYSLESRPENGKFRHKGAVGGYATLEEALERV